LQHAPGFEDVNTDQQNSGLQALLTYDRPTAARLGITPQVLDQTLYDAFGEAEVSTIYTQQNQYYVVMEAAPQYWKSPHGLKDTWLAPNSGGGATPLNSVVKYTASTSPLAVNHTGLFPSVTVSFNLAQGVSLGEATKEINDLQEKLGIPTPFTGNSREHWRPSSNRWEASLT
jgi:multidrug efflux pump